MENIQIILNTESTLYFFLISNYFKKYLITYVRTCKCKGFKILKSVN